MQDVRGVGGITSVDWYGSIVSGPHMGKAPPPHAVGANGFFKIVADSVRNTAGIVVRNNWFVDLDDEYFRGGDVLRYFWLAQDVLGGVASDPQGLSGVPGSRAEAENVTGGLLEVSFLPTINWDPAYLARVQSDAHGKLEPTAQELINSTQARCILYSQGINTRRLSGDANRTSVMYTLDHLGYRDLYDVFDHQGLGNTNNHLGGRATVPQAIGYALIIYDRGNAGPGTILPDGRDLDGEKVDQAAWFQSYLAQGVNSEVGIANLWIIASNAVEEKSTNALFTNEMQVVFVGGNQGLNSNPDIEGQTSMAFSNGSVVNFAGDLFSSNGGCPTPSNYDALATTSGIITHVYKDPYNGTLGDGAIVMNADPVNKWNTIMQSHPWFHIRDPEGVPSAPQPEEILMTKVLTAILPQGCEAGDNATGGDEGEDSGAAPLRTTLYQNFPNPFNPWTTIRFDLSRTSHVQLEIYDVAGRLVRRLVNDMMPAGPQNLSWNGLDESGTPVASGLYLYRLETPAFAATRKMLVMR